MRARTMCYNKGVSPELLNELDCVGKEVNGKLKQVDLLEGTTFTTRPEHPVVKIVYDKKTVVLRAYSRPLSVKERTTT